MNLIDLKKEIPSKWRVQSFSRNKPCAVFVSYIDARAVMDLLDKVCSPENWQNDYKIIDGGLFAGIGIKCGEEWVWKWDMGIESKEDAEKGEASDSFKRAAVKWGIGRFLYATGIQYVKANEKKTNTNHPYTVDGSGNRIYDLTKHINVIVLQKPSGNVKTADSKPKKKQVYKDFKFLGEMRKQKNALSEEVYYQIMGGEGYEHSNEIPPKDREKIWLKLEHKRKELKGES